MDVSFTFKILYAQQSIYAKCENMKNYLHDMHRLFKFRFVYFTFYYARLSIYIYSLIELKSVFFLFYFIFIPIFTINNLSMI